MYVMYEDKIPKRNFCALSPTTIYYEEQSKKKSKAVPLHAMEAHGGRGGIAPTHT
jgi:hypothetical protein